MTGARDRWAAAAVFSLLLVVYLLTFSGHYHASDEQSMLAATDSLARRGAWDSELVRWMGEQQGSFGPDGHLYSRKGIGTTLAALPLYWLALHSKLVGNVQAAMLTNALVTALTGALIYLYARRLGYGRGVAAATALAFGLATMAWPYARYLFSEPLAGFGVLAAAYFMLRYRDERDAASLLLAGAGLGLALLARLNYAIVAPFLGLALLAYVKAPPPTSPLWPSAGTGGIEGGRPPSPLRHSDATGGIKGGRRLSPIVLFSLPVVAALAVTAWYNWLRFGSPLTTGYLPEERFSAPFFQGLYGLLLSPGKGLLWYNPILFGALAAWPAFTRRHRAEGWLAAGIVAANVVFYAPWYLWWGGHAWGPRFLVAALPFAALPLAEALEWVRGRRLAAAGLATLALVSVGVQGLGVAVDFNQYLDDIYARLGLYHPATLFDPAYSPLLRQAGYLRLDNLDLAWPPVALSVALVIAALALLAPIALVVTRPAPTCSPQPGGGRPGNKWGPWPGIALALAGTAVAALAAELLVLPHFAPSGDVARAARLVALVERPGEAVAIADSLLTGPFQDAYDGRLPLWGVPLREIPGREGSTWVVGGPPGTAATRFQVGGVGLALDTPPGDVFTTDRLRGVSCPVRRSPSAVELACDQVGAGTVRPGESVSVALVWRDVAPPDTSYTMFVQVIDANGVKAGQWDRIPCDGACPTTTWRPGDLIGEWLDVPIRADAAPGRYSIIAGMYDLASGRRLAVRYPVGSDGADYVLLGSVEVRR